MPAMPGYINCFSELAESFTNSGATAAVMTVHAVQLPTLANWCKY
ncbi:hypothetical protein AAKU67_002268 [Oxalobacteraceae bacterium GrIS 2.11]